MTAPSIPNPLPDHSSKKFADSAAGAGQPLYTEHLGQAYFQPNPPNGPVYTDETSLSPGSYLLGLTMTRVYSLLSDMIQSMQQMAVAQSNNLNILTVWQNVYNAKMNSVHTFAQNNGDAYISDTSSPSGNSRQDLNQVNSAYTENMRSSSSIVSDDAKAMQTTINQTQDAVNNQSNLATSIIQQFATILASLYSS